MPKNAEFVLYAFGITIFVISAYYLRMVLKLRSIRRKQHELKKGTEA